MKIIVCGSRIFNDFVLLKRTLDRLTKKLDRKKLVILSGGAKGADRLGEQWAFQKLIAYCRYPPDYDRHGSKLAPLMRNQEMVDDCEESDGVVAFWDGVSPGTADLIGRARKKGLKIRIIRFTESN